MFIHHQNSLGRGGHVQKGHPGDSAQGGQRGSTNGAAADPVGTSDDFLRETRTYLILSHFLCHSVCTVTIQVANLIGFKMC